MDDDARELADLIGAGATIALAERYGGIRMHVPAVIDADSLLVRIVGKDAALRLTDRYPDGSIKVPFAYRLRARHYRNQGMNEPLIATKLGITQARVGRLLTPEDVL